MLATAMKHELEHLGFMVVGPAQSVQRARTLIAGDPPDVAVLDISLGDEEVYPLIPELEAAGVPIVLLSGHDLASLPAEVGHLPVLAKPVEVEDLKRFLLEHCPGASARD